MSDLTKKHCVPCEGRVPSLTRETGLNFLKQTPGWTITETPPLHIERELKFKNFQEAIAFVNRAADLAESEGHHPDILIHGWNKVKLTLFTHAINGLSENDFILAAKINKL